MQNLLKATILFAIIAFGPAAAGCASAQNSGRDSGALVRVAVVKLVNASRQPNYDYLSASLTDAAQSSMDKQFVYAPVAAAQTADLAASLEKKDGIMENADLRSYALAMDADLIICGFFRTTPGKKGDTAEISVTVFRADKGAPIGNLTRKALISGSIFKDIDVLAADVVRQIAEYRKSQNAATGKKEPAETSGEKIHLTRDSLNMLPFIPPVF